VLGRAMFLRAGERLRFAMRMATVVPLSVSALTFACSPMKYVMNAKKGAVDACIRTSCTGPSVMQSRDYEVCEATCRERHGQ
jgi:hypothetical protein